MSADNSFKPITDPKILKTVKDKYSRQTNLSFCWGYKLEQKHSQFS